MKKILFTIITIVLLGFSVKAQELTWHTDVNEASQIAMDENKPMLLFFTGSDWCGWCIRLQKEVFFKLDFQKWAKNNVVLVELDFPRRTQLDQATKSQNYQLQSVFKVRGYPTIHFVNPERKPDGKINFNALGKTGYVRGGAEKRLAVAEGIIN